MRNNGNIFEAESRAGPRSGAAWVTVALSVFSALALVLVIACFRELTARIALWMVDFLSSALPLMLVILAIILFLAMLIGRLRRGLFRR